MQEQPDDGQTLSTAVHGTGILKLMKKDAYFYFLWLCGNGIKMWFLQ